MCSGKRTAALHTGTLSAHVTSICLLITSIIISEEISENTEKFKDHETTGSFTTR